MSQHIYTYDPANDQLNEIGGAGHIIKDESGTSFTKRENLQFNGMTVTDDATSNSTIVEPIETNFVGTWAQWQALTLAERAQYETVDLLDDFNGAPIDPTPTKDSINAVQSGGVYDALDPMLNVLGAKNLLLIIATSQTLDGITFTVNNDGSVLVSGTASNSIDLRINNNSTTFKNGKYVLTGGYSNNLSLKLYTLNTVAEIDSDYGEGFEFIANESERYGVYISIPSGATINNILVKPMIRPASVEDDTYVPYAMTNRELTLKTAIHHGTVSGTTDSYGRLVQTGISGKNLIVLDAYIQGQSYQVTPYRYVTTDGTSESINFIVLHSDSTNYVRVSNTAVTVHYYYISK